ncbi:MAG: hypothetical protein D6678_05580 [Zetaproteobacteria bacterium]|nr:MAG: hypothetical protein D6678_05580 [Zetaproteobacteria bacterium]
MKRLFILLPLLLLPAQLRAATIEVDILFADRFRPHVQVIKTLKPLLRADDVRLFAAREDGNLDDERAQLGHIIKRHPDLLIVVGEDALQAALAVSPSIPVLSVMSMSLHAQLQRNNPWLTGIDMRPPPERVARDLASLLPRGATVLSYYTPALSRTYIDAVRARMRDQHLVLAAQPWPEDKVAAHLLADMQQSDAYWMQLEYASAEPDVLRLLFALSHQGKTLIGLSEKYVRAGARATWAVDLEGLGRQAAAMANRILRGTPPAQLPLAHPERIRFIQQVERP